MQSLWAVPAASDLPSMGAMSTRDRALRTARGGGRILPLIGAPVLSMPDHVRRAAQEALDEPDPRDSRGLPELRAAIAAELSAYGLDVDPERRLLVTHGAMQGLSVVLRTVLAPGDEVIVPTPTFFFDGAVREAGASPVYVPSRESDGWVLDVAGLEAAITSRTRVILLCNPNNPTGDLPDATTLSAVVDLAAQHGLLIVSDDSWQHFTYDGRRYQPIEAYAERWPHIVTITSLSKYYALASWRLGYVLGPPSIVDAVERRFQWESVCCGIVPQRAAVAALTGPRDWLQDALSEYQAKRDLVCDGIVAAGLPEPVRPAAGAFLLVDCSALGSTPDGIEHVLLQNGIAAVRGSDMHGPAGHVRLVYGADVPTLTALTSALAAAVEQTSTGGNL